MIVREIHAKTILSRSKVLEYTVNPYTGCEHGCTYCYARFVGRMMGHKEDWGSFVDVKVNAPKLLRHEVGRKKVGRVWLSGVCDPYQPLERRYGLTRRCLKILLEKSWPVMVQTKSPLVLRDLELLKSFDQVEVGLTVTTADEKIKKIFEPNSPPIKDRIETLGKLRSAGVKVFAMIAPILPKAEDLVEKLLGKTDYVLLDRMNYHYADWVYKKHGLEYAITNNFFTQKKRELTNSFGEKGIPCYSLF